MKDKVYPSKEVAPFHDSFVWAYLNVDQAATRKVMKSFQIRGVPYIAIISKHGEVLEANTGLIKSPALVEMVKRGLEKAGPIQVTPVDRAENQPAQKKRPFGIFKRKQ